LHFIVHINLNPAVATAMHCISISYIVTLLVSLIHPKLLRQIIQAICLVFAATDFALNVYCLHQFNYAFDADIALLILGTDPNEAKEFLSTMLPPGVVLAVAGVFLLFFLLWCFLRHRNTNLGYKTSLFALALVCICIAGNLYRWNVWKSGPLAPICQLMTYDIPSDLKSYYSHPKLIYDENEQPVNVVLIIGESFARCHSSIYGYGKLTNPELTELKNESLLYSFDSINSPAFSTALSIRDMLSTYNISDTVSNDKKWFEYTTLIEIMKDMGYECYWFGNQASANMHNGPSRIFAEDCDRQWFLQREGLDDVGEHRYDIVLVDSSYNYVGQLNHVKHNFFIFHMMGSHFDYSQRYPKEYAQFTVNDYPTDPENHRAILSAYDNSILYNDFVVRKIMDLFKDSEALIIYLSDHGQVMYRNKNLPDHYAHGVQTDSLNVALGEEVPFFVYASPLFQQKHPQTVERIKNRQDNPKVWNSEDLPYFIMDLIGIKEINGETVSARSVL
jgi:heptose-I-phosphate ethanolaminephosphotransferase